VSGLLVAMIVASVLAFAVLWGGRVFYPAAPSRLQRMLKVLFLVLSGVVVVLFTVLASLSFGVPFSRPDRWVILSIFGLVIGVMYYEKLVEPTEHSNGRD
jgi:hypothetical protein